MWVNTTLATLTAFTELSSWGNSSTTPGRFTYAFGPNAASQMRAQTRYDAGANGTDIFAQNATTPSPVNNGTWHMLSWTFDTGSKVLSSYYDGALINTFTSAAASSQMVTGSSAFGTLGYKGDTGNFLNMGSVTYDEIYVFRGAATAAEISNLYTLNAIPEPTSLALAGISALLLGGVRRRAVAR